MKQDTDIAVKLPGILIIHQKIKGREKGSHIHDEHEIFLPLQGEISIKSAGKAILAGPGKMIYIPPKTEHTFHSKSSNLGERLILIVDNKKWKDLGGEKHELKSSPVSQLCKEILFHLIIHPKTKASNSLLETLIITFSEMLEEKQEADIQSLKYHTKDERIVRALDYIEKNASKDFSMDDLSSHSGMSLRTMNRLFMTEVNMTPKEVMTFFRMEEAKKLLKQQSLSVTDVAFEVGYKSLSQFITTFRRLTGVLPSDYM